MAAESMTSATSQPFAATGSSLPPAGPTATPQLVEIDVGPWRRISVLFRATQVAKSEESGSIWYWRPDEMACLER